MEDVFWFVFKIACLICLCTGYAFIWFVIQEWWGKREHNKPDPAMLQRELRELQSSRMNAEEKMKHAYDEQVEEARRIVAYMRRRQ